MGRRCEPEELQQGFEVGDDLVLSEEGIAVNGLGIALDTEVASQLHIEANLPSNRDVQEMQVGHRLKLHSSVDYHPHPQKTTETSE